jgi:hypothetical protein
LAAVKLTTILVTKLHIVQKEEFSITCSCTICTLGERLSISIRDRPIFLSGRVLHKDYGCNDSVGKIKSLVVSLKELDTKTN